MAREIDSKSVRAWIKSVAEHEYFKYLVELVASQNRFNGWEQDSEWMEMKANGYRCGFEEVLNALSNLRNLEPAPQEESSHESDDYFEQDPGLPDHVDNRFS